MLSAATRRTAFLIINPHHRCLVPPLAMWRPAAAVTAAGVACEQFRSAAGAEEWLRAERHHLLAAIRLAAAGGFRHHAWELAWAASPFLRGQAY